jgi:hypothetical protein
MKTSQIEVPTSAAKALLLTALSPNIRRSASKVAIVVGSVLNLINQGPAIWGHADTSWVHVALNFFVPFCVSSYSAAKNQISRSDG